MHRNVFKHYLLALIQAILIPAVSQAQELEPSVRLEKSASYIFSNKIRAFRVPTIDIEGKVRFFDVAVDLIVNPDGTLGSTADVAFSFSPVVATSLIRGGTYKSSSENAACTVNNLTLVGGRIQSFFECDTGGSFTMSLANGLISSGHPFETELVNSGIDKKPDVNTFTWGIVTDVSDASPDIGSCRFFKGYRVGAKTNGNLLILSLFHPSSGEFRCSGTMNRQ